LTRASKALYVCLALASIVAMTIPIAYPVWLASQQKASPYNSVSVSNPTLGIRLDLSVASTSIKAGDDITITIGEYNMRAGENQIGTASNWKIKGLSLGPCNFDSPIGLAIMQGYYTKDSIAAGLHLALWHPGIYFCQDEGGGGIVSYTFDPASSLATIVTYQGPNTTFKLQTENQVHFSGSWTEGTLPFQEDASFQPFSHGMYTLVGGDEWGDILILNFTVS
jgi:hypothetical protein